MAWTRYQLFLAALMVVTGSLNTLSTKWADKLQSVNSVGQLRSFEHPFVQACSMFVGEFSCLYAFFGALLWHRWRQQRRQVSVQSPANIERQPAGASALTDANLHFNPLLFVAPALCDMVGTSTMYVGLTLTYASSFQMLRGAVIVFTGLLSRLVLGRRLGARRWLGIALVLVGLVLVGVSDFLLPVAPTEGAGGGSDGGHSASNVVIGDALIVLAQLVVSVQMVIEERYVSTADVPPLLAVGFEGMFGMTALGVLLLPMYYVHVPVRFSGSPHGRLEDVWDAFAQLQNSWRLTAAFCGTVVSIAFFNFAGVSVTKELSATTRMVLDSVRTLVIYGVSLALRWQRFQTLQPLGFVVLLLGMSVYNDVLVTPWLRRRGCRSALVAASDEGGTGEVGQQGDLAQEERQSLVGSPTARLSDVE